jgi:hypothetical protein
MMRLFINVFIFLFLMDGAVSICDDLLAFFYNLAFLNNIRDMLATVVLVTACLVYISLGVDQRLPKRRLLPLIFYSYLSLVLLWFFPQFADNKPFGLFFSVIQLFLGLMPYSPLPLVGERTLFLDKERLQGAIFGARNSLIFTAISMVVIPFALISVLLATADSYARGMTSGFMRIAPSGMYMADRIYQQGGKTIRLVGMIHIGEQGYYEDLARTETSGRTIILAEGVSDRQGILKSRFGYGKMAGFLGLTSQEKLRFHGRQIESEELDAEEDDKALESDNSLKSADILRADVDIASFRPQTIMFLDAIGRYMNGGDSFRANMAAFNAWAEKNVTPEVNRTVMDDILHQRNKVVIRHIGAVLGRYDTVIIPWGALHMAEIEQAVLSRGFVLQENRSRVSIDFLNIAKRKLFASGQK